MERELKRPYPRVWDGARLSYGGSQHWFAEETMRRCGCGVVACADALLYLTGRGELPMEKYRDYANHLRRYFPLIPRRGIDGVRLALGFNACLRGSGLPVRARWCASGATVRSCPCAWTTICARSCVSVRSRRESHTGLSRP